MHDGPAQSLTNITLQAQIVERLLDRDIEMARGELRLLVQMVQQTLEATKNFIFDVRPMVLDDLGLVPTLRRAARDRGRRAHVPVEFDSMGTDRRLPQDVESTVFRVLDEALGAYLSLSPERVTLRLDWTEELEARLTAERTVALPAGHAEELPDVPAAGRPRRAQADDRGPARCADRGVAAAEDAAIVVLPAAARRDIMERAGVHRRDGGDPRRTAASCGSSCRCRPSRRRRSRRPRMSGRAGAEGGPGILETSIVLGRPRSSCPRDHLSSAGSSPDAIGAPRGRGDAAGVDRAARGADLPASHWYQWASGVPRALRYHGAALDRG